MEPRSFGGSQSPVYYLFAGLFALSAIAAWFGDHSGKGILLILASLGCVAQARTGAPRPYLTLDQESITVVDLALPRWGSRLPEVVERRVRWRDVVAIERKGRSEITLATRQETVRISLQPLSYREKKEFLQLFESLCTQRGL